MSNPRHRTPLRLPVKKPEFPAPPPPADKAAPHHSPMVRIRLPVLPPFNPPAAKAATPAKANPSPRPSKGAAASKPSSSPPHSPKKNAHPPSSLADKSNEEKADNSDEDQHETQTKPENCPICMDDCTEPKQLSKCGHIFCTDCIDHYFNAVKPQCPCCFTIYGEIRGNQPEDGTMKHIVTQHRLPGFKHDSTGTIQINYHFPNGIQDDRHPNPGMPYHGTDRDAYLPYNDEGRHVLKLLEKSFDLRQTFTVGQSRTTGTDNVVTWNDIHHKTSYKGGMQNFGYPDATYLNRVQQELAAKGIK